jgi:hypothetical protein
MINCSHPAYFEGAPVEGDWLDRLPALTLWGGCWAAAVGRTTGTSARSARNASLLIPSVTSVTQLQVRSLVGCPNDHFSVQVVAHKGRVNVVHSSLASSQVTSAVHRNILD